MPEEKEVLFCPEDCRYLKYTEAEQDQFKNIGHNVEHWCGKYKTKLFHLGSHPRIESSTLCNQQLKEE